MKCTHHQNQNWVIEVQFIVKKHSQLYPVADLTCNNLALKASASGRTFELVLAGESHLNLEATLVLTKRKEFGIQSGSIIPRVLQRAATRKVYGWIQVPVEPVDRVDQFEFSENQLYLKSKGMLPTTELPVALSVESAWIMVQQKEEVNEELKRKRDEKIEARAREKRARYEDDYEEALAKFEGSENVRLAMMKKDWTAMIFFEFPEAKGITKLTIQEMEHKFLELSEMRDANNQ